MPLLWSLLLMCLLLAVPEAESRSFPTTPDALEAQQQHWGSLQRGYIASGCVVEPQSGLTVQVGTCRAFVLETGDPPALKGVAEDAAALTLSGADGTYWVGLRQSPGLAVSGWTCLDGRHLCWKGSATPPAVPSGLLVLAKLPVTLGVVGVSIVMAPWHRTTPYVVPAGQTLTLGVCPAPERVQLWDANGTTSGLVRFGRGACGEVYPEWWGADPTFTVDSTAAWQQAIDAVSGIGDRANTDERIAIACEGSYLLASTLTVRPRLNIHGRFKVSSPGAKTVACELRFAGSGHLFDGPDLGGGAAYHDMDFRHLFLIDTNATADTAFRFVRPTGLTMENLFIYGFKTTLYLVGEMTYGNISGVHGRMYRERCVEISGPANFAQVDVQCSASEATVLYGVRVGVEPLWFGSSQNLKLRASVEAASGTPIILVEQRGLDAELYVEQPGQCADYSIYGAIWLYRVHGGRIHLSATGNCAGEGGPIARGLYAQSSPTAPNPGVNNVVFTGRLHVNYQIPVSIEKGPGMWGNDITHLEFELQPSQIGDFTTGIMLGGSYWTHGLVPALDEGMGNTNMGTIWPIGSLIWNQGGANEAANYFHQVVEAGNPPTVARLNLPAVNGYHAPANTAQPSVREGNTFHSRILVDEDLDAADAITNFTNAVVGLCLDIIAQGARTITHGTQIRLAGSTDYAMVTGNTLRLCADSALGPWREVGRCSTCN